MRILERKSGDMLVEFRVGNYRSFRDLTTLSMIAAQLRSKDSKLDQNNVFQIPGAPPLLTTAAIYGPNASGKSNLIRAFHFMRSFVLGSTKETRAIGAIDVESFRLHTKTIDQPSHFEVVFVAGGKRYRYGFEVTKERVEEEWLFYVPRTREARLFERWGDEIKLGPSFKEGRGLVDKTRPNALFLSVAAQFNGPIAQQIVQWFQHMGVISGIQDLDIRVYTMRRFLDDPNAAKEITALIKRLDLGIVDLNVQEAPVAREALPEGLPEAVQDALLALMDASSMKLTVATSHPIYDEQGKRANVVDFDLDTHESEGTKKLFALAGPLVDTLKNGRVLVVDELDARLHPLLTREIVSLFNSPRTNPKHAQLIFTTQDTNLLDNRFLRRDQVWFTEKDRQGASHLYSLVEFKVRNDAAFEKDYVRGRYGAIPYLGGLRQMIGEEV